MFLIIADSESLMDNPRITDFTHRIPNPGFSAVYSSIRISCTDAVTVEDGGARCVLRGDRAADGSLACALRV
jgi:hypothetical protein